jgi:hypothetical protein
LTAAEVQPQLPGPTTPQKPTGANRAAPVAAQPRNARSGSGRPSLWLPVAGAGLCALSAAAAIVSYAAQYRLVYAARHLVVAALLEAAIPDAAALVFACLGVALAVHGRRAVRARMLNAASAGGSVFMNMIAAAPGWRNLAVWAMPPAMYALASDTLIGVVRTGAVTRRNAEVPGGGAAEFSFLAALSGLALWLLRLSLAPRSTAGGFRQWVLEECPVAPGRRAPDPAGVALPGRPEDHRPGGRTTADRARPRQPGRVRQIAARPPATTASGSHRRPGGARVRETKTSRFLALVAREHGPLAAIPLASVARISAAFAPHVGLHAGSARTALRRAVLAAQLEAGPQTPENDQPPENGDR